MLREQALTRSSSAADSTTSVFWLAASYAFQPTRRNLLHWLSWAVALTIELALVGVLWDGQIYEWEQWLTRRLQEIPGKTLVFDVSSTLTNTLSLPFIVLMLSLATLFAVLRHPGAGAMLLLTFPLHIMAQFPKALVDRARPSSAFDGIEGVGGLQSFPSGHSEYVVTFYGFLAYIVMLHLKEKWQQRLVLVSWLFFVLATGFGRIAEGRHWPLDVAASYIVGLGLLSGMIWLHTAFRYAKGEMLVRGDWPREDWPEEDRREDAGSVPA